MNWIRQEKRLAIYLRDGLACAYCGHSVEDGAQLTLDHIRPHSQGGSNREDNLVTACQRCNSSRGTRALHEFAVAVASYLNHGVKPLSITTHVLDCAARELPKDEAKVMIARRGSVARVLASRRA